MAPAPLANVRRSPIPERVGLILLALGLGAALAFLTPDDPVPQTPAAPAVSAVHDLVVSSPAQALAGLVAITPASGGYGSGFVAESRQVLPETPGLGYRSLIVTCCHLFGGQHTAAAAQVYPATAFTPDGLAGTVIYADPVADVAVIAVYTVMPLQCLTVASLDEAPRFGDEVFALGFPVTGPHAPWLSQGRLADAQRVQILTAPGSSGGPIVNAQGKVVGLARAYYTTIPGLSVIVPLEHIHEALAKVHAP